MALEQWISQMALILACQAILSFSASVSPTVKNQHPNPALRTCRDLFVRISCINAGKCDVHAWEKAGLIKGYAWLLFANIREDGVKMGGPERRARKRSFSVLARSQDLVVSGPCLAPYTDHCILVHAVCSDWSHT